MTSGVIREFAMHSTEANTMQVRWMIRRDMPEVLDIETACFNRFAWTEEDFLTCLRQRNAIGMVAEENDRIIGFMLYELLKHQLHVVNFAVSPRQQRRGVGTLMFAKLINKLHVNRRSEIRFEVRESNDAMQLFLRACGAVCERTIRNFCVDTGEDAYQFFYRLKTQRELQNPWHAGNRISKFL